MTPNARGYGLCPGLNAVLRGGDVIGVPLNQAAGKLSLVSPDHALIAAARAVGTCFGD